MGTLKPYRSQWGILLLSSVLAACAPGLDQFRDRQRQMAPESQSQTGQVVQGLAETDLVHLLKTQPDLEFRVISPKHELYEIFGTDLDHLHQVLPAGVHSDSNHYISLPQVFAKNLGEEDCRPSAPGRPPIQVVKPQGLQSGQRMLLGQSLQLTVEGSGEEFSWVVRHPLGSQKIRSSAQGTDLEFKPDSLGLYDIVLRGKTETGDCRSEQFQIIVTDNPKFNPPPLEEVLKHKAEYPLEQFGHLEEISVPRAWEILSQQTPPDLNSPESSPVILAIIDSGTNYNHPALARNIYINPNEIPDNQIDDDGNGFIDDVVGYDFRNGDPYPFDDSGHGSHVAGLAASSHFGVARNVQILSLKVLDSLGGDLGSMAGAIYYAVDQGARVINLSAGYYQIVSPIVTRAVQYAESQGVLIVAAAGNGLGGFGVSNDRIPMFPASLPNDNVVSVAAKDEFGIVASYSNFGAHSVDVIAPGGSTIGGAKLKSCYIDNPRGLTYHESAGTSMAAPLVAGTAAKILSLRPELSASELRSLLRQSGDFDSRLRPFVGSSRFFNSAQALELALTPQSETP